MAAHPALFAAAYPADPADAYAALADGTDPWPGPAILWVRLEGGRGRVLDGHPRAIARVLGRPSGSDRRPR